MSLRSGVSSPSLSLEEAPAVSALLDALSRTGQASSVAALLNGQSDVQDLSLKHLERCCEHQGLEACLFESGCKSSEIAGAVILVELEAGQHYAVVESDEPGSEPGARHCTNYRVGAEPYTESLDEPAWKELNDRPCLMVYHYESSAPDHRALDGFSDWIWRECFGLRKVYRDVLLASVLLNLFVVASPLFVMNVYDRVVPNHALDTLWALAVGLGAVLLFDLLIKVLRHHFLELSGRRLDLVLSKRLFRHVLNVRPDLQSGSLGSALSQFKDFDAIKQFFGAASITAMVDLPFAALFLIIIFTIGGDVAWAPAIAALLIMTYGALIHFPLKKQVEFSQQLSAYRNGVLAESLSIIETLKVLNAEGQAQSRWNRVSTELAIIGLRLRRLADSIGFVSGFIVQFTVLAVVVIGVYQIAANELSLGALIACVLLTSRVLGPMVQVANLAAQYFQARSAIEDLNRLTQLPTEQGEAHRYLAHAELTGEILLTDGILSFDGKNKVLNDLNVDIKPGEHVGLIGTIGSGKTSLLRLFVGLNRLTSGQLKIDGFDIDQLNPADLRAGIAYVPQEIQLFSGTLRENLNVSFPKVSDQRLIEVLDGVGMGQFVRAHAMGLDMPIGERGQGLSGGQKQSIAIARCLVHDPSMLMFDELTSAMDNQTENQVLTYVQKRAQGKTLLLSTHRASLLALVDRVIVLDAGRVVADGPKHQVLDALKKGLIGSGARK